jgi:predicted lipoprotein with Yx(FWY)xxD motif
MASESKPPAGGGGNAGTNGGARGWLSRHPLVTGLAAAALAGLLAACGSGNGSTAAAGGTAGGQQKGVGVIVISTRTVAGVGTVLTDQSGMTLYTPQQEARGVIKCTAGCLSFWLPVTVGKGATPRAASTITGTLGSIQRSDDRARQLTYNGQPLYKFRLDEAPGQVHGNNFTDQFGGQTFTWHAIAAGGGAATPGQPASPSGDNPYQGGSMGY